MGRSKEFQKLYNIKVRQHKVRKHYQALVTYKKEPNWIYPHILTHYLSDPSKGSFPPVEPTKFQKLPEADLSYYPWSPDMKEHQRVLSSPYPSPAHIHKCHLIIKSAIRKPNIPFDTVPIRTFDNSFKQFIFNSDRLLLLTIELITGKTHQIRAQLAAEGLYIIGDYLYGCPTEFIGKGNAMALCCVDLQFTCPLTKKDYHFTLIQDAATSNMISDHQLKPRILKLL